MNAPTLWDAIGGPRDDGDDDRTVMRPAPGSGNELAPGHSLQEFVIEGLVGEGGFSIVYLARDTRLGRRVALKEYMPSTLAARGTHHDVTARSERVRETFQLGLRSFVNEARLLASFDHPSLVKVYRFWEHGGTAYMVMPYYEGPTLKSWLAQCASPPSEAWLRALVGALGDALELIHEDHCWHRDIAPDNILLLTQHGANPLHAQTLRPVLLDFGAARRVIGDATHVLTAILKPGYAPIEQYAESSAMKQGPWTDVYALCAVLYAGVTGHAPLPSVGRIIVDELLSATQAGAGRYSQSFLAAIDAGLAVRPEHRPQDVPALRRLFDAGGDRRAHALRAVVPRDGEASALHTIAMPAPAASDERTVAPAPATATFFDPAPWRNAPPPSTDREPVWRDSAPPWQSAATPSHDPQAPRFAASAPARRGGALWIAGALTTIALAGALWWWLVKGEPDLSSSQTQTTAASGAGQGTPAPFSVLAALHDIVARGDPRLAVTAVAGNPTLTIGRDQLQFRVDSTESGYLYVYFAGTDQSQIQLLFPNHLDRNNRIEANQGLTLPRQGWNITAAGPAGTNHLVATVSRRPRDLSAAGLRPSNDEIAEFDLAQAQQRWQQSQGRKHLFVGTAMCDASAPCDEGYGAAMLEIREVDAVSPPSR